MAAFLKTIRSKIDFKINPITLAVICFMTNEMKKGREATDRLEKAGKESAEAYKELREVISALPPASIEARFASMRLYELKMLRMYENYKRSSENPLPLEEWRLLIDKDIAMGILSEV